MNELIVKIRARFTALGQSLKTFYSANKGVVLSGITVLSILLIVWARLGFTFQIGQFFAAQLPAPAVLSVQCTATQAILTWNIPPNSTTNAIQKNVNGQGWQFVYQEQAAPYTVITLTDPFTPTTVYRHKSDPNVVSNLVQCPLATTPTPSPTPTATATVTPLCSATSPAALTASQITAQAAVLSWTPGVGGAFQQLRVGSNQEEVRLGCQTNPTTCAVVEHNLPSTQASYPIPSGRLVANTTYYWRVVNFSTTTCYPDSTASFTTASITTPTPTPTSTPTPTPTPTQTTRPPAPSGCYYQEVQCVTTPCDPVLICPSPTPTPSLTPVGTPIPVLSMNALVANLSTNPGAYSPAVTATSNQNVLVRVVLANGANTDSVSLGGAASSLNVSLKATVPQGLVYVPGSTMLNGTTISADTITTGGVALGALHAGESMTVDFRVNVNGASFPPGQTQAAITMQAQAENGSSANGTVTVIVQKATATGGQPGTVQTGPGDAVVAALLISAILTLLYVSYTRTSVFRRREVETITRERDPLDFRS